MVKNGLVKPQSPFTWFVGEGVRESQSSFLWFVIKKDLLSLPHSRLFGRVGDGSRFLAREDLSPKKGG